MDKTVLVVEDDKGVQKLLADALEDEGFRVICETDGSWALKTFEKRDIDFLIIDVLIPVMNGFQLAQRVRKTAKGENVPILMISGVYKAASYKDEAIRKYGVAEYLDKPLRLEQVFAVMRRTLGDGYPGPIPPPTAEEAPAQPAGPEADSAGMAERQEVEAFIEDPTTLEMSGNLKDITFADLLARLYKRQATGVLLARFGNVKKIIYLQDGRPVSVKSNLLNECLGRILLNERIITQADMDKSVELMKSGGRLQGTVLMEMGVISPHNLVYALEKQLEAKLYDVFGWPDGEFQFNPRPLAEVPVVTLELSTASMISEGIKRRVQAARIEAELESNMEYFITPNPDPRLRFQDLLMDADESAILQTFEGTPRLRDYLARPPIPREKLLKFIYTLKITGIIIFSPVSTGAMPPPLPVQPPPLPVRPPPLRPAASGGAASERIFAKAAEMREKDFYGLLGVPHDAPAEHISRSFNALAREFHPDRLSASAGPDVKKVAAEVFAALGKAHETLTDPQKRREYDAGPGGGPLRQTGAVSNIIAAAGIFEKGRTHLDRRMFAKAIDCFREAISMCETEADFHAYLGWSIYVSDPGNPEAVRQAVTSLGRAVSLNPRLEKGHLFLGRIYRNSGRPDLAGRQFEKAVQCNPDSAEALEELKQIDAQRYGI